MGIGGGERAGKRCGWGGTRRAQPCLIENLNLGPFSTTWRLLILWQLKKYHTINFGTTFLTRLKGQNLKCLRYCGGHFCSTVGLVLQAA